VPTEGEIEQTWSNCRDKDKAIQELQNILITRKRAEEIQVLKSTAKAQQEQLDSLTNLTSSKRRLKKWKIFLLNVCELFLSIS
jgi:hypothetical protein